MPAVIAPINIEAGSYEPRYWLVTDPVTLQPINLTVTGFVVTGEVQTRSNGSGAVVLALPDALWRRTTDGRIYFQPDSATTAAWPSVSAYYQAEISHPSGETVRFSEGPFTVDTEFV